MKVKGIGMFFAVVSVFATHGSLIGAAEHIRQEQSQTKSVCEEILVAKCSDCHHLTRVCQKLGKKSKGDWRRSIKRMVRKGAVLSKDEQKILVQCMYKQQEGAKKACQK